MENQTSTACVVSDQGGVPLKREEQVYACIRKEMGIVFLLDVISNAAKGAFGVSVFSAHAESI